MDGPAFSPRYYARDRICILPSHGSRQRLTSYRPRSSSLALAVGGSAGRARLELPIHIAPLYWMRQLGTPLPLIGKIDRLATRRAGVRGEAEPSQRQFDFCGRG